jgi:hypothetical protein
MSWSHRDFRPYIFRRKLLSSATIKTDLGGGENRRPPIADSWRGRHTLGLPAAWIKTYPGFI